MRLLFTMDKRDYGDCTHTFVRDSARSIILRDGKAAMIHSLKYGFYKFPGGGIEPGETPAEAMIRETREEAGLVVIPETVREFGLVHRIQKSTGDPTEIFVQDNYYFLCDAEEEAVSPDLDDYEAEEQFALEFVDPHAAIRRNRSLLLGPGSRPMFAREARILEILIEEGYLE